MAGRVEKDLQKVGRRRNVDRFRRFQCRSELRLAKVYDSFAGANSYILPNITVEA